MCFVVGFEIDEVDYPNENCECFHKLQLVSNHVLINCATTAKKTQQINMLCACGYVLLYQQVHAIKPIGLTNQLETHKSYT